MFQYFLWVFVVVFVVLYVCGFIVVLVLFLGGWGGGVQSQWCAEGCKSAAMCGHCPHIAADGVERSGQRRGEEHRRSVTFSHIILTLIQPVLANTIKLS